MKVDPKFVDIVPYTLVQGVVYVCLPCKVVCHLCPCGCGCEVVTPLTPLDWSLTYDGKHVSLYPSIGGWHLKCQSHYFIRRNEVIWAGRMSRALIEHGRRTRERAGVGLGAHEPDTLFGRWLEHWRKRKKKLLP